MSLLQQLFGEGRDLNALQMSVRAVVMFIITLILIRIAGTKTFGKTSAFDNIVIIMLGAILSRGVVGVSPFLDVVCAGLSMVLMTRLFSLLTLQSKMFSRLIKGEPRSLFKNGVINKVNLRKTLLNEGDLAESTRLNANLNTLEQVEEICLECNGEMSVIKKNA